MPVSQAVAQGYRGGDHDEIGINDGEDAAAGFPRNGPAGSA
jgi:hypothetical protein